MKNLTASDRTALLNLATALPKGSEERRAILAGLKAAAQQDPKDYKVGDKVLWHAMAGKGTVTEVTPKGLSIEWPNGDVSHPSVGSAMLSKGRGISKASGLAKADGA